MTTTLDDLEGTHLGADSEACAQCVAAAVDRGGPGDRGIHRGSGQDVLRRQRFGRHDEPTAGRRQTLQPKVVNYEIFGPASHADINYLDLDAKPKRSTAPLPWTLVLSTTAPSVSPNISPKATVTTSAAASPSTTKSRTENTTGVHAQTFCLVKSA